MWQITYYLVICHIIKRKQFLLFQLKDFLEFEIIRSITH